MDQIAFVFRELNIYWSSVLLLVAVWVAIFLFAEYDEKLLPGQNYSVVGSKTESEPTESSAVTDPEN